MIGIKNFATCECDLPATGDQNTNPEYTYRFCCPRQQRQDVAEGDRGCDFSLSISLSSNTIPPYYKFKIEETDQGVVSFHEKTLRAFLEWRGMTRKRTLERALQVRVIRNSILLFVSSKQCLCSTISCIDRKREELR